MQKPNYKALEKQIKSLKGNIKGLNESKNDFNALIYNIPKMFKIIELIYDESGKAIDYYFREINKKFMLFTNLSKSQLINKRYREVIGEIPDEWLICYSEILKTNISVSGIILNSPENIKYEISAWKIDSNKLAIVFSDVTDQNNQQLEILNDKNKAEEKNRLKSEFISNLSHEIRTPMNGIIGFSGFLNNHDLTIEKRKQYIRIIQNSGHQLLRIVDDLIEISSLETKQLVASEQPFCFNEMLFDLFTVFDLRAKENKTPLYLKRGLSDEASTIFSDRSKLNKIISNLIDNALKFTSDGYIEFGYLLHEENLRIYVEDTGVGIAIQKQESIFERFSKENNEMSNNVSGLGLGLSIAKENTKLLRGEISVKSKKGKGTTFFVDIPYKPLKTSKSKKLIKSSEIKKESAQSILIADDEEVNYLYLEILLKEVFKVNCEIIHAKNGKEAIKQCEINSKIKIVFMDLKMPLIDGYKAMKMIKKIRPNLIIVAQTASSSEEDIRKITTSGFDDYMIKPINNEAFDEVLKKYNLVIITN